MIFFILGSKQKKKPPKGKQDSNKKQVFSESKNKVVAEEMTLTVMRSQRISRRPSDWWMVKSQESKYFYLTDTL